jgi:hypothetical protein
MGVKLTSQSGQSVAYVQEFVADKLEDIENLPTNCAAGSQCICIENASVWVLNTEKVWCSL